MKQGDVDVFIKTFDESKESENLANNIPKSKRDAIWSLSGIKPTSSPT